MLKHVARYKHVGSFKSWLRQIARNKVRDLKRKRAEEHGDTQLFESELDPSPTPDELWERRWLEEHLRFCLERIRADIAGHTYEAFYRVVLQGQRATQVARDLELSVKQVYVAKHRVLDRMRMQVLELGGVDL